MQISSPCFFFVRLLDRYVRIDVADIMYAEACGKETKLFLKDRVLLLPVHLKKLQEALKDYGIYRIHRSYLVALRHVTAFNQEEVFINGLSLPLTTFYRDQWINAIDIVNRVGSEIILETADSSLS